MPSFSYLNCPTFGPECKGEIGKNKKNLPAVWVPICCAALYGRIKENSYQPFHFGFDNGHYCWIICFANSASRKFLRGENPLCATAKLQIGGIRRKPP